MMRVRFEFRTGIRRSIFRHLRLMGSWDGAGRHSDTWSTQELQPFTAEDGCPAWWGEVELADSERGKAFAWGVVLDSPHRANIWGIPTESGATEGDTRHREFTLLRDGQNECFWLTHCRRLGANKWTVPDQAAPAVRFSVWAPYARRVETVIGETASGYIWPDGRGVRQVFPMRRDDDGIWSTDPADPLLADFAAWDHKPYMFRITREDGSVVYRTDLYSRCQIGSGKQNPEAAGHTWNGTRQDLDGTKSCSVVVDPERVTKHFHEPDFPENEWLAAEEFWANEFDPLRPLPNCAEDLVIYELHVGALGFDSPAPGTLEHAIGFLDHLSDLGVNAVELLPMSEYEGWANWGYGTSHYFAIEYAGGGRDQFKFFVRACHQRGIAVILDVVYNHYTHDAERAEWMVDSSKHEHNIYYWYEGRPGDYPADRPDGGYLDNGSTGYTPAFHSEMVRKMMIGSAVALMVEFHVDGFRMDLTQAIHRDNVRHADGSPVAAANACGCRFLREWVRTLRLIKPEQILMAEDHTGWSAMTRPQETGGIGFDAVWGAEWYHHLVGDATNDGGKARLIKRAGPGGDEGLPMDRLAALLPATPRRVIYHESHDEAGNSSYWEDGREVHSARTIMVAVNNVLNDHSRPWAEARCRVAAGLTLLAAGIPMFFMGEEVGAANPYRYDDFLFNREDFATLRKQSGAALFRFYQDLLHLRRRAAALRSPALEILHVHNDNRILAFRRWWGDEEFVVVAGLNNAPFESGYIIPHPSLAGKSWLEVLSSDAGEYGGRGVCNPQPLAVGEAAFAPRLPAVGLAVFQRI